MTISTVDLGIIILFFVVTLGIGLWMTRGVSTSKAGYFLSDRDLPWWLLGVSMVATTFSADTPNLVTDIVRKQGVAGNWQWWAFLLTGMLTVFVYARLWRRSGIDTDIAFYELRYSGPVARFLRGFRAIYLGVFFNVVIMATVLLAGIKIAGVMLGLSAIQTVLLVSVVTVVYSGIGGFKGVVFTDFFQFILSMIGLILAAIYIVNLPAVGGMDGLLAHSNVVDKTSFLPDFNDKDSLYVLFVMPIAIQWWNVWYPGAEPGGGGYVAQRMLSAKDEEHAVTATLLFNVAHYALRPWPWILIALASLIVYPDLASLETAFPDIDAQYLADDLAFSAMLTQLPTGLFGLVVASLIAALMSTISTHLNWGASYVVSDVYERFVEPDLSGRKAVWLGRLTTGVLMVLAAVVALRLQSALEAFQLLLQIGAGTGLLFILRWFWWRINGYSEITAMVVSFVVAVVFAEVSDFGLSSSEQLLVGIAMTTICWVVVTFITPATDSVVLQRFYQQIQPHSMGWGPIAAQADVGTSKGSSLGREVGMMVLGCFAVYATLFGIGYILYSQWLSASIAMTVSVACFITIANLWKSKT
jgi:Na+/proline symporter